MKKQKEEQRQLYFRIPKSNAEDFYNFQRLYGLNNNNTLLKLLTIAKLWTEEKEIEKKEIQAIDFHKKDSQLSEVVKNFAGDFENLKSRIVKIEELVTADSEIINNFNLQDLEDEEKEIFLSEAVGKYLNTNRAFIENTISDLVIKSISNLVNKSVEESSRGNYNPFLKNRG